MSGGREMTTLEIILLVFNLLQFFLLLGIFILPGCLERKYMRAKDFVEIYESLFLEKRDEGE